MAFSSLQSFSSNNLMLNDKKNLKKSYVTITSLASSSLGDSIKDAFSGEIYSNKMTVSAATGSNVHFNGDYLYKGILYAGTTGTTKIYEFSGIFDGLDTEVYSIPASNSECWVQIDMPVGVVIKKIYHNCPTTSTNINIIAKGSNDMGYTWTTIATHTITHLNRNTANVPTILSSTAFRSIRYELTNTLASVAQIWVLDFVGDFYDISLTTAKASSLITTGMYFVGDTDSSRVGVISNNSITNFKSSVINYNSYIITGIPNNTNNYNKSVYNGLYWYSGSNLTYGGVSNTIDYYRLTDLNYSEGYILGTTPSYLIMKIPFFMYVTKIRWWFNTFITSPTPTIQLSGTSNYGITWVNISNVLTITVNDTETTTLLTGSVNQTTFANTYNYFRFAFTGNGSSIAYIDFYGDICQ